MESNNPSPLIKIECDGMSPELLDKFWDSVLAGLLGLFYFKFFWLRDLRLESIKLNYDAPESYQY